MISQPETAAQNSPQDPEQQQHPEQQKLFFERRPGRILLFSAMGLYALVLLVVGLFYLKFVPKINQRLTAGPFSGSVNIFSAPRSVAVGDALDADDVLGRLRRAGYTRSRANTVGWYNVRPHAVEIFPGRDSYA